MTLYAYDGGRVGTMQSWPCPTRSPAKNVTPNPASITLGLDFEDFEGRLRGLRGTDGTFSDFWETTETIQPP